MDGIYYSKQNKVANKLPSKLLAIFSRQVKIIKGNQNMSNTAFVYTKQELERAIDNKVQTIHIMDRKLASSIKTVKSTSKVALTAGLIGTGVATTNFWNPIGWSAAAVTATVSSTIIIAISILGGAIIIWAIYNNYTIKGKRTVTKPDGTVEETEITMERDQLFRDDV